MTKNYFILYVQYNRITLFTEKNGQIVNIDFANGKNELSNCVTFSYEKEDLEFLPDGDPFDVNSNSSFSDFLDFAGYHFVPEDGLEAIVTALIKDKMIPGLGKNDDIFILCQSFYFESEFDVEKNEMNENHRDVLGHKIYIYDMFGILSASGASISRRIAMNIVVAYPFLTFSQTCIDKSTTNVLFAPTIEGNARKKALEKIPLPTHLPSKLLRNVNNRIIVSKLFGLPIPEKVTFQNRVIDIPKEKLTQIFDEIVKEDSNVYTDKLKENTNEQTIVFDFGMYPVLKDAYFSVLKNPVFMDVKENVKFTSFMMRNMIIHHLVANDYVFKGEAIHHRGKLVDKNAIFKVNNYVYYDLDFIEAYLRVTKRINLLTNKETKVLKEAVENILTQNEIK